MAITWILVAQGSGGKIVRVENNVKIATIKEFFHPKTAQKDHEIHSDKQGRTFQSAGHMRHAKDYGEELTDHERGVFAKKIVDYLSDGLNKDSFSKLVLVSSPHLLGEIKKALSEPLKKVVAHYIDKDLFSQAMSEKDLVDKLRQDLDLVAI